MSLKKIMNIIGLGLIVLMIISLFFPLTSGSNASINTWELLESDSLNIVVLIELILGVIILGLNIFGVLKDGNLSVFSLGYLLTNYIGIFIKAINNDSINYLRYGYYIELISSIGALVVIIIGYFINDYSPTNNNRYNQMPQGPVGYNNPPMGPQQPYYNQQPTIIGYDQQTGQPIYR